MQVVGDLHAEMDRERSRCRRARWTTRTRLPAEPSGTCATVDSPRRSAGRPRLRQTSRAGASRHWRAKPLPAMRISPPGMAASGVMRSMRGFELFSNVLRDLVAWISPPSGFTCPSAGQTRAPSAAYRPAVQSSAMMPRPPGRDSACRAGNGFQISKTRKSINPSEQIFPVQRRERRGRR